MGCYASKNKALRNKDSFDKKTAEIEPDKPNL
jgi:hypothetical protein